MNPIIRRELLEVLRTRKALAAQIGLGLVCALLVLARWPTDEVSSGSRSLDVLRVFGYGLLAGILLMVPAYPATALVRERMSGTLTLLLTSPMTPASIYFGKLAGVLGFTGILLAMTLPAAGACHALGGTAAAWGIVSLYGVLGMAAVQVSTLGLLVSSRSHSTDGALRATYALVLAVSVLVLAPHELLRGDTGLLAEATSWLRCLSPVPAVMDILSQGDVGTSGISTRGDPVSRYLILAALTSLGCAAATIAHLHRNLLDRSRPAGVMTQDRSTGQQFLRRILFLVDPQWRSGNMSLWVNPVLVKEFRSRRFGRLHWTLRLLAGCAMLSLLLSYIAASGILGWGFDLIGGALVLLQVSLLILFAPSLAAGLFSSEREAGTWDLLRLTPLSPGAILRGKLLSVAWPLLLLLCATLPGYVVMITLQPTLVHHVQRVVVCLLLTAVFAVLLSAALSTLFHSTAQATTASYMLLLLVCVGPLLVWLGREAPFGHTAVEAVLTINPVAAALQASEMQGFSQYNLLPTNWWIVGSACLVLLVFLRVRVWQMYRPQ